MSIHTGHSGACLVLCHFRTGLLQLNPGRSDPEHYSTSATDPQFSYMTCFQPYVVLPHHLIAMLQLLASCTVYTGIYIFFFTRVPQSTFHTLHALSDPLAQARHCIKAMAVSWWNVLSLDVWIADSLAQMYAFGVQGNNEHVAALMFLTWLRMGHFDLLMEVM